MCQQVSHVTLDHGDLNRFRCSVDLYVTLFRLYAYIQITVGANLNENAIVIACVAFKYSNFMKNTFRSCIAINDKTRMLYFNLNHPLNSPEWHRKLLDDFRAEVDEIFYIYYFCIA